MKALLLHDDSTLASRVKALLQRASKHADAAIRWRVCSRPFNSLLRPSTADGVLSAAVDAHLLVLAGHYTQSLPLYVYHWLERWADSRQVPDAPLALLDSGHGFHLANATPELSSFASKHELTIMIEDTPELRTGAKLTVRSVLEHEFPVAVVQARFAENPKHHGYRAWGINE